VFDGDDRDAAGAARLAGTSRELVGNSDASVAARNVQAGLDYYARTFGRDGIDDAGAGVDVVINDHSTNDAGAEMFQGNGGYYATPTADGGTYEAIRYGGGNRYQAARGMVDQLPMLNADDLAVHELTHGLIRKETGYLGGHANESGATNEAIADVMAASATRDWRIGESMYTPGSAYTAMRDIAHPNDTTVVHGLWTTMDAVRQRQARGEEAEEHWASGVLSTAAYRVQQRLGGEAGWSAVERVFYDTIDNGRLGDMSFAAVAGGLRAAATTLYGTSSVQYQVLDEELKRGQL